MEVRLAKSIGITVAVFLSLSLRAVGSLPSTDEIDSSAVEMDQHGVIRSPNFPGCCWPNAYLIEYEGRPGTGFIRLIFDDLDLPKESVLQIHDGANETARPFPVQPSYVEGGSWLRPFIASTGGQVFVKFTPGAVTSKEFVGFKAYYWTVKTPGPETWKKDQPFTDCPRIGDPMDGGEVKLGVIQFPWQHIRYQFDCVWQLKPPKGQSDRLHIYFRITTMNLENGRAQLHRDTSSDGPSAALFKNLEAVTHSQLEAAGQPRQGYSSETGFYIRVKKPTEEGHFKFVYGVYVEVAKTAESCSINFDGKSLAGFVCKEEYDDKKWCIPREHICNSLPNCPDASDEDHALCKTTTISPTPTPHGDSCFLKECQDGSCVQFDKGCPGECGMFEKSCPNGACVSILEKNCPVGLPEQRCSVTEKLCMNGKCLNFLESCPEQCLEVEKKCNDGTCVSRFYGTCPGECNFQQKRCKNNNMCVSLYERCPEDACPSYKPFKCDVDKCLYTSQTCDNVYHCEDKTDESDCDAEASVGLSPLLALVALPIFVIVIVVRICCRASRNQPPTSDRKSIKPGLVVGLLLTLFCLISIALYFCYHGNKSLSGPSSKTSSIVIIPVLLVVLVSFIFIVGCFYGRKRKCRGQHMSAAGATQNGTAYTGTRMQPVPAASAGISPGNGRSAVTYQPHYGTSGSPRDQHPPSTPAGNGPDNLLNNYSTYMSDPPSYTSNPPSLRRSSERLIPPGHADERTHLDPSPAPAPGTLAPPGAGGLTPTAPPPSYDEAMQAAVPSAPPAPSPHATPNLGLTPNSGGCSIRNNHHSLPNVTLALPQTNKGPSRSNSFRHERHHSMMMNHQSLPNFSLAVQPTKTGFGSFRSYRELPTYDNVMTSNGTQGKSPQNHPPPRPPDPDSDPGEQETEPTITTTRRREPKSRMRGIHGWGGGIFDTSSSDQDSTSSDD